MAFIDEVLHTPAYGWKNENGELIKPTRKELFREFFSRTNIFKSKRNWISTSVVFACATPTSGSTTARAP